jgi:hypothetical protein
MTLLILYSYAFRIDHERRRLGARALGRHDGRVRCEGGDCGA